MCSPGSGPEPGEVRELEALPDGTRIVSDNGRCARVRYKPCFTKCLPPATRIATPNGNVPVRDVQVGTEIWTRDDLGRRIVGRVELVGSVEIIGEHHVARLVLDDGRTLTVSPQHPTVDALVQELRVGDVYDGASIVRLDFVPYTGARTFDLLPSGPSGIYWADGVPLRSTLGDRR